MTLDALRTRFLSASGTSRSMLAFMAEFDRRDWLRMVALAAGGSIVAHQLFAEPARGGASPAAADTRIRLSLNENPYGPAPGVIAAIRREFANLCRYTDDGFGQLVALIAAKERLPEEQIILGEILEPLGAHLSLQGGSGGEFIYSDPGYTALIDSAAAVGGIGVSIPLSRGMQNDLPAIAAKVNRRTRAVFLVNPHNPTGTVMEAGPLRSFVQGVSKRALVIVDEAYLEFSDKYAEQTLSDLVREGENVIVFRTFAKVYGLAGLDIGYGLVPKNISQILKKQGLDNPHLFNRIAVAAAVASLEDIGYVAAVAAKVAQERNLWFSLFHELKMKFTESSGNFVFFETGIPHEAFSAGMLKQGVDIGRAFPPYERWARISIGLPQENAIARAVVQNLLAKG
jgi:histidinol-phosphate aminotransferase